MPRGPRLDGPGVIHHVMARGVERRAIVHDQRDRREFVARVVALAQLGAWTVYAWAVPPNHVHLRVRTGNRPPARTMGTLLAGYAGAFDHRDRRHGHLAQECYHSGRIRGKPSSYRSCPIGETGRVRGGRRKKMAVIASWGGDGGKG